MTNLNSALELAPRGPHCIVIVAELRPVSTRIGGSLQFSYSARRPLGIAIPGLYHSWLGFSAIGARSRGRGRGVCCQQLGVVVHHSKLERSTSELGH
jgi:hypothetical protein